MVPEAAEASLALLQGSIRPQDETAEIGVGWASAWAAAAYLAWEAVQGDGGAVGVVYWRAFEA